MSSDIVFITRHYPPNSNINGESVCDMVEYLSGTPEITTHVICIDRQADGVGNGRRPAGNVIRLKTLYQGDNPLLRFVTFLYDGWRLMLEARKFKNSLVVVTTSPPLLPMWATLLLRKKTRWAMWSFDLFPEGFQVTNFIGKSNPLYRFARKITYAGRPDFLIALGEQQAIYLQKAYQETIPAQILPCGVFVHQEAETGAPDWWIPNFIYLGYCGNIGDPHNPEFIKAAIDHVNPDTQRLVLALYGKKADAVKTYAMGKPGVVLVDRVPRNQLHFIDIHLVSLTTAWTHIAVPSKAISAVCMGSSILFCGDKESDNWYMLQKAGWFIAENDTMPDQVNSFLSVLKTSDIAEKKAAAQQISQQLHENVRKTYTFIRAKI
jgi:hypothetical protein